MIAEEYTKDGAKKSIFHRVGTMFEARSGEGFNLEIPPGIALSGRVIIRPRKAAGTAENPPEDDIPY